MEIDEVLRQMGGVSTRARLVAVTSRAAVDRAVASGRVVALARDRYALPSVDEAVARAHALSGVLSLTSAALHHGWAVKQLPGEPHVTVRRKRKLRPEQRRGVQVHYADLMPEDTDGIATSKELTLLQCLRVLPLDESLPIADSAVREGDEAALRRAARSARGPGSAQVRRVAELARPEAANAFESVLRAITLEIPGAHFVPQVLITDVRPWVQPDLVDEDRRIVLEADSFEWHGKRVALREDARRYDLLVAADWLVLRFAWEDVMFDPDFVRGVVAAVISRVDRQAQLRCRRCPAA